VEEWEIIARWYRLRKLGLLFPLLHTPGHFYTFMAEEDPWGTKESIKTEDLVALILWEESLLGR
jgi:hypothetical protein